MLLLVSQETTYLEACIENHTKTNLYMDQVEFEPAPNWSAKILKADEHKSEDNSPSRCVTDVLFGMTSLNYASFNFRCVIAFTRELFRSLSGTDLIRLYFFYYLSYAADREILKPPVLVQSGGGIRNYLYQLSLSSLGSAQSNVLGKLQITWRTNLGEPGRLQTQQILGTVSVLHWY